MADKLWFISEDDAVIAVFDDRDTAKEEMYYYKEDNPIGKYKVYGLLMKELEDYADEYDLAESEGLI